MRVLVVDDDEDLRDVLGYVLRRKGYGVTAVGSGELALTHLEKEPADLMLLDVSLPKMDGIEVCKTVRKSSNLPIIMLTVLGSEKDVVKSLEAGADDHIAKPFDHGELTARMEAVLRRCYRPRQQRGGDPLDVPLENGGITIDPRTHSVTREGEQLDLTPLEFKLLHYLMLNAGQVVTPRSILERVWGYDNENDYDVVRVHMFRLRQKLEVDPKRPGFIHTVSGVGYRFRPLAAA